MNHKQKIELQKLIENNNDYKDNTELLREIKISNVIKNELNFFLRHKNDTNTLNIEYLFNL